jgi:2-keto-4-pentenoate hydratase/2-oxohepta-3-ene-1,7-dioic acid hydratase in catechol pathway
MRIVNWSGRLAIELHDGLVDVSDASRGAFGPDVQAVYDRWDEFVRWAAGVTTATHPLPPRDELGPTVPAPRQVFVIGLNYQDHADETGSSVPDVPVVFTKFPSSIAGPYGELQLTGNRVDYEVELVVVIGQQAQDVSESDAWSYVAGLTVGNDYSDRRVQMAGAPAQFSLGKSFPGFSPLGPRLVTLDELDDYADLGIECAVNGVVKQSSRTSKMIFDVPYIVRRLSSIVTLFPGDIIFTGTPGGNAVGQRPMVFLEDGDVVTTTIEGIGVLEHTCVGA